MHIFCSLVYYLVWVSLWKWLRFLWNKLWVVFTGLITFCRSKGYRNSKGKVTAFVSTYVSIFKCLWFQIFFLFIFESNLYSVCWLELWWLKKHSPYSGFRDYVRCILCKYLVQVLVVGCVLKDYMRIFIRGWMILVEGCSNNSFYPVCSLANVDPIDVARNITGLNPETTLGKH